MDFEIIFENDYSIQIQFDNVVFTINTKTGMLYELRNDGEPTDIVIPHTFPSGHQIRYIASDKSDETTLVTPMIIGEFNQITISDDIFVGCEAFCYSDVKKVVWNNCPCIPTYCFMGSDVREVSNISSVEKIMEYAFEGCAIKEMIWPERCDTIPAGCFQGCKLLDKVIAPHVRKIGAYAFAYSSITAFDWPARCNKIPDRCFANSELKKINNIDGITGIDEFAFAYTKLEVLDLSGANISYLAPGAFGKLPDECKLVPPYYVDSMVLAAAMEIA